MKKKIGKTICHIILIDIQIFDHQFIIISFQFYALYRQLLIKNNK